jgi:hypothetical protein
MVKRKAKRNRAQATPAKRAGHAARRAAKVMRRMKRQR